MRAEKYEVPGKLPQSERAFFITGYAPAKDTGRIEESLTKAFTCVIDIEEIKEDEESPTLLSNNSFSASMEGLWSPMDFRREENLTRRRLCHSFMYFSSDDAF